MENIGNHYARTRSQTIKEISEALAKAQALVQSAEKTATNPHFEKTYAPLPAIFDAIRKPFGEHGIAVTQENDYIDGKWVVWTTARKGDEYIGHPTPIIMRGQTSQDFGAALTYARRQGLQTLVGVAADEDDDGNQASGKAAPPKQSANIKPARSNAQKTPENKPKKEISENTQLVLNAAQTHNWEVGDVKKFLISRFKKETVDSLTDSEIITLLEFIENTTFNLAMKELDSRGLK